MTARFARALLGAAALLPALAAGICTLPDVARQDVGSAACLGCHDGTVAADRHGAHLGRDYLAALRTGRFALRDTGPVRPVTLVEGRVECTSCHDGRAGLPHALAVRAEALCLACHAR